PRDKCCGDGLTAAALRELESLGFRPDGLTTWQPIDDVVVRSPSGREVVFPLPRDRGTYAAVVRREELDAAHVDVPRRAGATVADGHAFADIDVEHERVVVHVDGIGAVQARYAIAADGMWSPLRKAVGAVEPGYLGEWHAFRQYFSGVTGRGARELAVWFEADLLPGYAWSFPLPDGRANVGFGIQRGGKVATQEMKELWPELLAREFVRDFLGHDAAPELPHKAWPIPARIESAQLVAGAGRVLLVGDAAAATDPMTGEGIGQALLTGRLAAESIVATGPHGAGARYERAARAALEADAAMSRLLIRALKHRKGARAAVRVAGASAWTRRNFARWLFEDYPRAIVVTPRRWRSHSLRGDGAFVAPGRG
ncbi:MAG: menaquinone-9 beta-reductase, partial [Actinomycetota bacterium]|nr:menaquinone-9 beta-reductase [Actinomycetota bacterium]